MKRHKISGFGMQVGAAKEYPQTPGTSSTRLPRSAADQQRVRKTQIVRRVKLTPADVKIPVYHKKAESLKTQTHEELR